MALTFDHVILAVDDLPAAVASFSTLGFTVTPGGEHANGATHNALILFQDGTYLELMAPTGKDPVPGRVDYSFLVQNGEGPVGYALQSSALQQDVRAMRGRGLTIQEMPDGGRERPDGTQLRWRSARMPAHMAPFFMEDITPRALRVPTDAAKTQHANRALGVLSLAVVVENLIDAVNYYRDILGILPRMTSDGAVFTLDNLDLILVQPLEDAARAHLSQRAGAPYGLVLRVAEGSEARLLPLAQTHGARLTLSAQPTPELPRSG